MDTELMRLSEAIAKMSRSTISEVHSYGAPPRTVKQVMKAFFVILGENPKELNWQKIQSLMRTLGRYSMTKRVHHFRIKHLSHESASLAAKLLGDLELEEVECVSKMAATLFAWAKYIVREVEHTEEQRQKRDAANAEKMGENAYVDGDFEHESEGSKEGVIADAATASKTEFDDSPDI